MKMEPSAWGYNWATLSLGYINTVTWSSRLGVGRRADEYVLKKYIIAKSTKVKTRCNLAESSKEDYGSKRAVLSVMMMMMMIP
jgi:hypothetical protein